MGRYGWSGSFRHPDRSSPPGRPLLFLVAFAHGTDRISRAPHQAADPDVGALHPGDLFKAVDRLQNLADGLRQIWCHWCGPDEDLLVPSPELEVRSRGPYADRGGCVGVRVLARTSTAHTSFGTFVSTGTGHAMIIAAPHLPAALKLPQLDHAGTRGHSCCRSRRPPAQPPGKWGRLGHLRRPVLPGRRLRHQTEPAFATGIQHQSQNLADDVHSGSVPPRFPCGRGTAQGSRRPSRMGDLQGIIQQTPIADRLAYREKSLYSVHGNREEYPMTSLRHKRRGASE